MMLWVAGSLEGGAGGPAEQRCGEELQLSPPRETQWFLWGFGPARPGSVADGVFSERGSPKTQNKH